MTKPPRWNSGELFEAWTNTQLDEMEAQLNAQPNALYDDDIVVVDSSEQRKIGRVIRAAQAGDQKTLARLADTPELVQLALEQLTAKHKRGREKGERRPGDLSPDKKWRCEEALIDMLIIRQIWKVAYPNDYRGSTPLAIEFAARRWCIEDEVLINFKKNRHRRS
jgi:hypothetical protein